MDLWMVTEHNRPRCAIAVRYFTIYVATNDYHVVFPLSVYGHKPTLNGSELWPTARHLHECLILRVAYTLAEYSTQTCTHLSTHTRSVNVCAL